MKTTDTEETREHLLLQIEGAALFRATKAIQYQNDKRNLYSSAALNVLYKYVEHLPKNHPVFDKVYNMDERELEDFNNRLSRYGFGNWIEDPADFIQMEVMLKVYKTNMS